MSVFEMLRGKVQKLEFSEKEFPFIFVCKGEGMDGCKVWVHTLADPLRPDVAFMEGHFHVDDKPPVIHKNIENLPADFLTNIYHMARSRSLYEYNHNTDFYNGYTHFYELALKSWKENKNI